MKRLYVLSAAVAVLLSACAKSGLEKDSESAGIGGRINISIVDNTTTRADAQNKIEISEIIPGWQTPDWQKELKVLLACEDRSVMLDGGNSFKSYPSVEEFNAVSEAASTFVPALYTVKLVSAECRYADTATGVEASFGESAYLENAAPIAAEGVSKPYFEGRTSGVTVIKRQRADASVTVSVANSVIRFEFTDAFKGYYPKAQLKLTTESGFEAGFGYDAAAGEEFVQENYWVNPLSLKISGSVWGQSPSPGIIDAREVTFEMPVAADKVKPQYRCTYTFDISSVGNTEDNAGEERHGIRITLDSEPVGTNIITDGNGDDWFELNPDSSVEE